MLPMPALHTDDALRMATERLDGFRAEARATRTASPEPRARFSRIRALLADARVAVRDVETGGPVAQLTNYPYART